MHLFQTTFNKSHSLKYWRPCLFLLLIVVPISSYAQGLDSLQHNSNLKNKWIPVQDSLVIDSMSVVAGSFQLMGVSEADYNFNPELSLLTWSKKPVQDSVEIKYRSLAFSFFRTYAHKSGNLMDSAIAFPYYSFSEADSLPKGYVEFNSIDYNGTYGRSLSVGNNQDVSLNSNFNLQLNGYILDSVRIEAALADNNIPFQPDGNTQQLQEFDKVYITFEKGPHKLTAGDYSLHRPNSYFMNFDKRVQGLMFQTTFPNNEKIQNKVGFSGSIAKGEFARNEVQGKEGNQGPYKLTGNNGENFFIVLAGSERVFIDGILMERGEDRDYIIDYNTAEITFMPRRLITKDKRLQFEFEYQSRNYLNTLFYVYDELQIGKKWNLKFNAYSNQDSKNQPYLQTLDGDQKRFLSTIGDQTDQAFYRVIREDTFAANKILYKMIDTMVTGLTYDSIFVYTTNPDEAKYSLGFSFVGDKKGNYMISSENTNGRSYSWVAPMNNLPQGNYEPVVLLVTPKMQQMFTTAVDYQIDSFKKVSIELGASNYAPNLFSDIDQDKHWGFAGKINYEELRFFGKTDSLKKKKYTWANKISYEYVQDQFKEIAPFRNIEFSRDWNLQQDSLRKDEHYATFQTAISKRDWGKLQYNLTWFQQGEDFKANRNIVDFLYHHQTIRGAATFNLMSSDQRFQKSTFYRPSAFLEKNFPKMANITIGSRYQQELNNLRWKRSDSLLNNALSFKEINFYIRNGEEEKTKIELNYAIRADEKPNGEEFKAFSKSHTLEGNLTFTQIKNQIITLTGAYRKLIYQDSQVIKGPDDESILGRVEYNGTLLGGLINSTVLYELGSGQQQKQEYIYVEVPAGQGMYMWIDYNKDGVQQSNEFEIAIYPDQRKYIRIITPTNDYVKVNYTTLNAAIRIAPENLWMATEKNKLQGLISRFSNQLSLQINNRSLAEEGFSSFNPFASDISDENIIANLSSINNTVFFNQKSTKWGLEHNYSYNSGKTLLTYGLEANVQNRNNLKFRWNFFKFWTFTGNGSMGEKSYLSALPDDRTYQISMRSIEPSLTWLKPSLIRVTTSYKYDERQNSVQYGGENALIHSVNLDVRLSSNALGTIQAKGTFAKINYLGEKNTALSFVLLDALQKGTNWLWYVNWERKISKGIEISLDYEGRKSENTNIIHTGRMSIRALL